MLILGERLFSCNICEKSFQSSSALSKHKKRHEVSRAFACTLCPKTFKVNVDRVAHINRVHNKDETRRSSKAINS